MKKKTKKGLKWLLLAVVFTVLIPIVFIFERKAIEAGTFRRYGFTSGCIALALICYVGAFSILFGKNQFVPGTLIVEDVFKMKTGGCVVVGRVKGRLQEGDDITIQDRSGNKIETKINAMEINRQKKVVAIDTPVALHLKKVEADAVHAEDVIMNIDEG